MKAITDVVGFFGMIVIIIGIAIVVITFSSQIFGGFGGVGCDTKKTESMSTILRDSGKPNSVNAVTFTLPDCVAGFWVHDYSYCFKDQGKDYECVDTQKTGEMISFSVREVGGGSYCFYVYGTGALGNPNPNNPSVVYVRDGKC